MLDWFTRKKTPQPEWLIVGLGNPGAQYEGTRHNVGFMVIDALAKEFNIKVNRTVDFALTGIGTIEGVPVCLAKPLTFMNACGGSVRRLLSRYHLPVERLVVIADEIAFDVGEARLKPHGGSGGHNGHKSIIESLKTDRYARIRIGIGKPKGSQVDYVLSPFSADEREKVEESVQKAVSIIKRICAEGMQSALSKGGLSFD
jgi:PTH1 family peptidyl-tRNA hydrolase